MINATRKLSAILAADVVGYSTKMAEDEERTLSELRVLREEILLPLTDRYQGMIIKSMGDGWLMEFGSAFDAVNCGIQIQEETVLHQSIQLRVGIHIGDVVHEDQDIFGDGVNIAARLQELSQPGGIIISDLVHRSISKFRGTEFASLGARRLKNMPDAVLLFGWRGSHDHPVGKQNTGREKWAGKEALIVALAQTGDQAAFSELVANYQSRIRNLMRRACRDTDLADDLAQQVFLLAWQKIHKLRHPHKFAGWLRRMAINTWLTHLRKNDTLRDAEIYDDTDGLQEPTSGAAIDLDHALAQLPGQMRLCVVLAYHEGMTHAEIVEHTNIASGTVKSNIRRGAQRLQNILSDYRPSAELGNLDE